MHPETMHLVDTSNESVKPIIKAQLEAELAQLRKSQNGDLSIPWDRDTMFPRMNEIQRLLDEHAYDAAANADLEKMSPEALTQEIARLDLMQAHGDPNWNDVAFARLERARIVRAQRKNK